MPTGCPPGRRKDQQGDQKPHCRAHCSRRRASSVWHAWATEGHTEVRAQSHSYEDWMRDEYLPPLAVRWNAYAACSSIHTACSSRRLRAADIRIALTQPDPNAEP